MDYVWPTLVVCQLLWFLWPWVARASLLGERRTYLSHDMAAGLHWFLPAVVVRLLRPPLAVFRKRRLLRVLQAVKL